MRDVAREPEVLLAVAYHMVVVGGVRNLDATKELRVALYTARPMEVDDDVNTWVVPRVQKDAQIIVLPMVEVEGATVKDALEQQEENQDYAFVMVVARDVKRRTAPRVQKASLVFASLMVVVGDAKHLGALKGHKGAPCTARLMVGEKDVRLLVVPKVLKGAPHFARAMAVGKDADSKEAAFVRRVSMGVPTSVSHMVGARDVLFRSAQKALGEGPTIACVMVEERDASLKAVARVHKEAQISARHMVEEKDVLGVILGLSMALNPVAHAIHSPEGRWVSVHFIVALCKIRGFMGVSHLDLLFRTLISARQRR